MAKFKVEELSEFARFYGFHYDSYNPHALVEEVYVDMERGLAGKTSSLPMLPSYITPVSKIPAGKTVLALDAGGTNLRSSIIQFNEYGEATQHATRKASMPGINGYVTEHQFFDIIADVTIPLLKEYKIEGIGFTFSYAIEITSDADGILTAFSKEVDAPDVVGKAIGKGLRDALARKNCSYDGPIVMLNDTVATLLSGYASISSDGTENSQNNFGIMPGPAIGFILGTGFNTAYPETCIPKIGYDRPDSPQVVNCESGNFYIRNRGILDIEYDNTTKNPGSYTLEKAASGAYIGPLTLHILKQAIKDKILNFTKSDKLLTLKQIESKVLNDLVCAPFATDGPLGSLFAPDEKDAIATLQYITSIVTERGALFSAAVLGATVKKINEGLELYLPVRIAVEGSTYLLYKGMRRSLESYLHQMLIKDKPQPYVISPVEQASLFGAAVAALCRF
jgi:hexokinase